jgi:hypothetical protein
VTDKQFNKPFFTEANSPVPLIPTDMAWDAMEKKLDGEKKKRRFIIWIPLRLFGLLSVLLSGAVAVIWWSNRPLKPLTVKNRFNPVGTNTQKVNNKKSVRISTPILTVNDPGQNTAPVNNYTRGLVFKPEERTRLVKKWAGQGDDKILPFAFPERISITGSILVQANKPLPALLFPTPAGDSSRKKKFWVEAGLQLNVPVPFEGYNYYLKGPDGNNQFYRVLLPGIWGAVNRNRHRLIATVNPFVSAPLTAKSYGDGMVPVTDSFSLFGHKKMVKMFGTQAQLQYDYRLTGRWSLGAGVNAAWWNKGLVLASPPDSGILFKPFLYSISPKKEEGVKAFQMNVSLSLSYQFKVGEGTIQISKPFNKTIPGTPAPVWLNLGIRWRLLNRKP